MNELPKIRKWLSEPLDRAATRQIEAIAIAPDVRYVRVMPDAHAGNEVCNGCVIATSRMVYPLAVGGDIGCGFAAAPLNIQTDALERARPGWALHQIGRSVPILRRHSRLAVPGGLSHPVLAGAAARDGAIELGTLGRGNHFVELARCPQGEVWVLVHSGSRAMGQLITSHHLKRAEAAGGASAGLDTATDAGRAYLADVEWACAYAIANRRTILESTAAALGAACDAERLVDAAHNTVSVEEVHAERLVVHRKGANAAHSGAMVIVAGSASSFSVIAEGRGSEESLNSCSHGAGRRLSRTAAAKAFSASDVEGQMRGVCFDRRAAGNLAGEAPEAYRDLRRVMETQRDLVKSRLRLTPIVSFKGT